MKLKALIFLSLTAPSTLAAQAPAATPNPKIAFESQAAVVQGITPGGRVVWFSLAREVADDDVATIVRRQQILTDEDGDGIVRFPLDREVPLRSLWVAVDLASGESTVAAPEGFPLRQVPWRGRGLGRDNARSDTVEDARPFAEVLVVRAGEVAVEQVDVVDGQAAGVGITYHSNGTINQIAHSNVVVVTQAKDPNSLSRPASISAANGTTTLWSTGTYQYDGTGNVWKIGISVEVTDTVAEIKERYTLF